MMTTTEQEEKDLKLKLSYVQCSLYLLQKIYCES